MLEGQPSRTAAAVAYLRTLHQEIDHPQVFVDPFADRMLGRELRERIEGRPVRGPDRLVRGPLRAWVAVRSRIAEEQVAVCHAAGTRQYVVLGAGLDTFALRNPHAGLRVFEVDHPRTQAWKRSLLAENGLADAARATFVPVDFVRDRLAVELARAGFDAAAPTVVSWLGVLPYLERPAIEATFAWAAGVVGASGALTFDYGARPARWDVVHRVAARALARRVAKLGEPIHTVPRPPEVRAMLEAAGFTNVTDLDGRAIDRRWFAGRSDRLRARGMGHVAIASRGAPHVR